jgi:hypothetical protein
MASKNLPVDYLQNNPTENVRATQVLPMSGSVAPARSIQQWNHLKERAKFAQQPIKTNFGWKSWDCELSLSGVQTFTDYLRCIVARLSGINERDQGSAYRPALEKITPAVNAFLSNFPGITWQQNDGEDPIARLMINICKIPATGDGYDLVRGIYDQLSAAEIEVKKNPTALFSETVFTRKQIIQLLAFFERNKDLVFPIRGFDVEAALRNLRGGIDAGPAK